MERGHSWQDSTRTASVGLSPAAVWDVVASGADARQWYADAAPFVVRRALDRLALGPARRHRPPGRPRLVAGDRVGFWEVAVADHREHRLVLDAQVRAPGTVRLEVRVQEAGSGSELTLQISFRPRGPIGLAYLLADLPARGLVTELAMLDLLTVLRRHTPDDDNRSATGSVHQT